MNRYDMRMMDGRNPYGSRGGYVSSRRMRRMRDRAMHEDYGYEHEMEDGRRRRNAKGQYMSDRAYEMPHEQKDYGSFHEEMGFRPVEAMGYFTGYYGGGEDYARSRRDMRYGGNYPMPMMEHRGRDYGYDYRGRYDYGYDYGSEMLDDKELEHWAKKLEKEVDEQYRHLFSKDNIKMRAEQMGIKFDKFSLEEFMVAVLMMYTDYHKSLGTSNMDIYYKLAKDWLCDEDVAVQYGEKLASYYDNIVDPE